VLFSNCKSGRIENPAANLGFRQHIEHRDRRKCW